MRLNRYIVMSGVGSRRQADTWVFAGRVKVNNQLVNTPGLQVKEGDEVTVDNQLVTPIVEKNYVVMYKPQRVVTTRHDPQGRVTVMEVLQKDFPDLLHLNPVGRLDQNTCGVLMFTNDGDLHHTLTHPSSKVIKEYEVILKDPMSYSVLKKIRMGVRLEDGFIRPDHIDFIDLPSRKAVLIRLHSGKNRVIRRLMEYMGVEIKLLKRIRFAGISLLGLQEGNSRKLSQQEVEELQKIISSISKMKQGGHSHRE